MDVIIQVDEEIQESFYLGGSCEKGAQEIFDITQKFKVNLEPLHPKNMDPTLKQYFRIQVEDAQMGERIAAEIRKAKGVKSAYLQPLDSEP